MVLIKTLRRKFIAFILLSFPNQNSTAQPYHPPTYDARYALRWLIRAGDLRGGDDRRQSNNNAGGPSKPVFLAKYIPATPPPLNRSEDGSRQTPPLALKQQGSVDEGRASPCPSPTPLFAQLYAAVAHWERVLAGSPDLLNEVLGKYSPELKDSARSEVGSASGGGGGAGELKKRTTSMHNLRVDSSGNLQRDVSIRRRSSPGGLSLATAAAAAARIRTNNEKSEDDGVAKQSFIGAHFHDNSVLSCQRYTISHQPN